MPTAWLELWGDRIVLIRDEGEGFDPEVTPAPSDYDVPAELADEWSRLDRMRDDGERFAEAVAAEGSRHYGGRF